MCNERKPWDSNPQAAYAATCFQDRLLIRPDDFRSQVAGVGIEPTPPGSEPGVTTSSNYPAMFLCTSNDIALQSEVRELRGQESNLRTPGSKPGILPAATTPHLERDGWDSNPRAGA